MEKMTQGSLRDAIHQVAGDANAPYTPPHLMTEGKRIAAVLGQLKGAAKRAVKFVNLGQELKRLGIKYSFSTEPLPAYLVVIKGKKFAIVNKKYAEDPDAVVGEMAIGALGESLAAAADLVEENDGGPVDEAKGPWGVLKHSLQYISNNAKDAVAHGKKQNIGFVLNSLFMAVQSLQTFLELHARMESDYRSEFTATAKAVKTANDKLRNLRDKFL
jgi:hypothetical protein